MKHLIALILLSLVPELIQAQTKEEYAYWRDSLQTQGLAQVSALIENGNPVRWPKLSLSSQDNQTEEGQRRISRSLKLAKLLRSKLAELGNNQMGKDAAQSSELIQTYGKISTGLKSSGGYLNYLLADVADECAIIEAGHAMLSGLRSPKDTELLLPTIAVRRNEVHDTIIKVLADNTFPDLAKIEVAKVQDAADIATLLDLLEPAGNDAVFGSVLQNHQLTSSMIEQRSLALLALRLAQTEQFKWVNLAGTARFLVRKGKLEDVRLDDITKFKDVMAEYRTEFSSPMLGTRTFYASQLKDFVAVCTDQDKRKQYLNSIVN